MNPTVQQQQEQQELHQNRKHACLATGKNGKAVQQIEFFLHSRKRLKALSPIWKKGEAEKRGSRHKPKRTE